MVCCTLPAGRPAAGLPLMPPGPRTVPWPLPGPRPVLQGRVSSPARPTLGPSTPAVRGAQYPQQHPSSGLQEQTSASPSDRALGQG